MPSLLFSLLLCCFALRLTLPLLLLCCELLLCFCSASALCLLSPLLWHCWLLACLPACLLAGWLAGWLALSIARSLARSLACLFVRSCLLARLPACSLACLLACSFACLLACSLARLLACLLALACLPARGLFLGLFSGLCNPSLTWGLTTCTSKSRGHLEFVCFATLGVRV